MAAPGAARPNRVPGSSRGPAVVNRRCRAITSNRASIPRLVHAAPGSGQDHQFQPAPDDLQLQRRTRRSRRGQSRIDAQNSKNRLVEQVRRLVEHRQRVEGITAPRDGRISTRVIRRAKVAKSSAPLQRSERPADRWRQDSRVGGIFFPLTTRPHDRRRGRTTVFVDLLRSAVIDDRGSGHRRRAGARRCSAKPGSSAARSRPPCPSGASLREANACAHWAFVERPSCARSLAPAEEAAGGPAPSSRVAATAGNGARRCRRRGRPVKPQESAPVAAEDCVVSSRVGAGRAYWCRHALVVRRMAASAQAAGRPVNVARKVCRLGEVAWCAVADRPTAEQLVGDSRRRAMA